MERSTAAALGSNLQLNTSLFLNCFEDIDNQTALQRLGGKTNNMAFIGCHLVDTRHYLANLLGASVGPSFDGLLDEITSIEDALALPDVEEIRCAWREIGDIVVKAILATSQRDFEKPSSKEFPTRDSSLRGAVGFLLQHEAYHIGQLGLLRKQFDFKAMSWKIDPNRNS